MEHFGAVFKLDLTEERRTQLSPLVSFWLRLYMATSVMFVDLGVEVAIIAY